MLPLEVGICEIIPFLNDKGHVCDSLKVDLTIILSCPKQKKKIAISIRNFFDLKLFIS